MASENLARMYLEYLRNGQADFSFSLGKMRAMLQALGLALAHIGTSEEEIAQLKRKFHARNARRYFQGMDSTWRVRVSENLAGLHEEMALGDLSPADIGADGEEFEKAVRHAEALTSGDWDKL